jgi:hypothetical protein
MALWQSLLRRGPIKRQDDKLGMGTGSVQPGGIKERVQRLAPIPTGDSRDDESPPIFFL